VVYRRPFAPGEERAVGLPDLPAAKKYGAITPAYNGVRGDKRWKIAYGDVVYITDEQQKLVITTYQIRPHRHPLADLPPPLADLPHPLADLPPWSSGPHDPPFFLKKQIHEGYARNI